MFETILDVWQDFEYASELDYMYKWCEKMLFSLEII